MYGGGGGLRLGEALWKEISHSLALINDSIDMLGPRGLNVVGRRLLRGSNVGNSHWLNATLLIGSTSSPHVGSTSGPHVIICRFHVGPTFSK